MKEEKASSVFFFIPFPMNVEFVSFLSHIWNDSFFSRPFPHWQSEGLSRRRRRIRRRRKSIERKAERVSVLSAFPFFFFSKNLEFFLLFFPILEAAFFFVLAEWRKRRRRKIIGNIGRKAELGSMFLYFFPKNVEFHFCFPYLEAIFFPVHFCVDWVKKGRWGREEVKRRRGRIST